MKGSLELKFSHSFSGTVWNTLVLPEEKVLILEIRDHEKRQVTFSALRYTDNIMLWRAVKLEEPWWVGLAAASQNIIIFTIYLDTANPDKKGILAYGLTDQKLLWWNNDFSLTSTVGNTVIGISSKYGVKEVTLDLKTGLEIKEMPQSPAELEPSILKPVQYTEGTPHFETLKTFLGRKLNLTPLVALEYLELDAFIFVSYYVAEGELVNYLLVMSSDGKVLLHEKLDEHLKGIGLDTFFILSGCVIFVRNKRELVSYSLI